MAQKFYIIAAHKKGANGETVYCRANDGSGSTGYSCTVTASPELARKFSMDCPNDAIQWMERIKSSVGRSCNPASLHAVVFEMNVRPITDEDSDWNKALRMNAISKLTEQEIVALGLQKHEIERRLNAE